MLALADHASDIAGPPAGLAADTASAIADAAFARASLIDGVDERLAKAEELLQVRKAKIDRCLASLRQAGSAMAELGMVGGIESDLTALIEFLRQDEYRVAREREAGGKLFTRVAKLARKLHPPIGNSLRPIIRRYDSLMVAWLESMRDSRWRLMVIRSEISRDGDGPIFDRGSDLRDYVSDRTT